MLEGVKIGVNGPLFKDSVAQAGIYETMRRLLLMGVHYIELSQIRPGSGYGERAASGHGGFWN